MSVNAESKDQALPGAIRKSATPRLHKLSKRRETAQTVSSEVQSKRMCAMPQGEHAMSIRMKESASGVWGGRKGLRLCIGRPLPGALADPRSQTLADSIENFFATALPHNPRPPSPSQQEPASCAPWQILLAHSARVCPYDVLVPQPRPPCWPKCGEPCRASWGAGDESRGEIAGSVAVCAKSNIREYLAGPPPSINVATIQIHFVRRAVLSRRCNPATNDTI
ncbi:hypothetical protein BU26DRAFT_21455 [Trematosphaeria pertusa]|uniref:Uncharacterized protein n=1 Tax=Trematosphaeria pertusa TaxID=390896 RepID=A0A6A6J0P8_9PLEO|nr:uncharacterized protein BU26DRAFT_21455 [Trematosphaeria pertusa]KAF2256415.1 hypothetical protein BU26DRAFT_21455 [Trematosphaeria pertusa]